MSNGFASFAEAPIDDLVGKMKAGLPKLPKQEEKVAQLVRGRTRI